MRIRHGFGRVCENGTKVFGFDLEEDQIVLTELNFQLREIPFEQLLTANAENLPFEDNCIDFIFLFGVLHHTPDTQKAIDEVCRVLNNDGQVIIMLYARGGKHYIKICLIHGLFQGKWF